jgi:hypothetical protein
MSLGHGQPGRHPGMCHPRRSSGQQILRNIAIQIENLRLAAWRIRIHWIPGYMGVPENETFGSSSKARSKHIRVCRSSHSDFRLPQ